LVYFGAGGGGDVLFFEAHLVELLPSPVSMLPFTSSMRYGG
jgi:hypothetical protein